MVLLSDMLQTLVGMATPSRPPLRPEAWRAWSENDWSTFTALARFHRVNALIAHRVQMGEVPALPEPWQTSLVKDLHRTRMQHVLADQRLSEIEHALKNAGISFISLKGPRLSMEVYPTVGVRPFDDLDLLVEPGQITEAHRVIKEHGYRPLSGSWALHFARCFHFHSQWFHQETRQCLELHWRPADRRTLPATSSGDPAYIDDLREQPAAMPVYLAVHLAKHGFANAFICRHQLDPLLALHPWCDTRLIWLIDFEMTVKSRKVDAHALGTMARAWHCEAAMERINYLGQLLPAGPWHPYDGSLSSLPRSSLRTLLLKRVARDMQRPAAWPPPPWWLQAHAFTGFRPIRLLDITPGQSS